MADLDSSKEGYSPPLQTRWTGNWSGRRQEPQL